MNAPDLRSELPDVRSAHLAHTSAAVLAKLLQDNPEQAHAHIRMQDTDLVVPRKAVELLRDILAEMAQGNAVTLMPLHAELTTQEAADALNVSRPYLVKLLESGAMPFTKAGTHRRIHLQDVIRYREQQSATSQKALQALVDQAQSHGMGY